MPKKSIKDLINVKEYFNNKKEWLSRQQTEMSNPIVACEEQRKFNAAVLRYQMTSFS